MSKQIRKIHHLRRVMPEYELAHEKAVFKTAAIVADTKKIVKEISVNVSLVEIRVLLESESAEIYSLLSKIGTQR